MDQTRVLIIEDEAIIAMELKMMLESKGHKVVSIAYTGEQAVELAESDHPDLILTEIILQGEMDGIEAVTKIHSRRKTPIIYITTIAYLKSDPRLIATNPVAVIAKPFKDAELFKAIDKALLKS